MHGQKNIKWSKVGSTEGGELVKQEYTRGYNSEMFHISCCDSNGSNYVKVKKSLLKANAQSHEKRPLYSLCPSIRPSVLRIYQRGSYWMDFREIWYTGLL